VAGFRGQPFDQGGETDAGIMVAAPDEDLGPVRDAGALTMFVATTDAGQEQTIWLPFGHMISAKSPGFPGPC
jgi:hypothetical protein